MTEADFERIEDAVMETERGRWFLLEYARRVRAESLGEMTGVLARLEDVLRRSFAPTPAAAAWPSRLARLEERLLDLAWRLREKGADGAHAAVVEEIDALHALAPELPNLPLQGSELLEPPAIGGASECADGRLTQRLREVDPRSAPHVQALDPPALAEHAPVAPEVAPISAAASPDEDSRIAAFAEIERMSDAERFAFFA